MSVGQRRQFTHVGDSLGQVDHGGAAAHESLETFGGGNTGAVVAEDQEDAGAAAKGGCHLVSGLAAQGGARTVTPG